MKKFIHEEEYIGNSTIRTERVFNAITDERETALLKKFTPDEQQEILRKKQILSSLAYFIGKDFNILLELGLPTPDCPSGWSQGRKSDGSEYLQMNADDLLHKDLDFLRFVVCHEGGHKRIYRIGIVPEEIWQQPGFSYMMNSIEDPRDNYFIAESYPGIREAVKTTYVKMLEDEVKAKESGKEKMGFVPRFSRAGFEYIKLWFKEMQEEPVEISEDLPEDIKAVLETTLAAARDSWKFYPSREEADKSEELIKKYAQISYEINRDKIWPEFKKLVEADIEDQKMQEELKKMQNNRTKKYPTMHGEGEDKRSETDDGIPEELKSEMTDDESKELEKLLNKVSTESGQMEDGAGLSNKPAKPVDLDKMSPELKDKIKKYIESLSQEQQDALEKTARKALKEFEQGLNDVLEGKLSSSTKDAGGGGEGREDSERTDQRGGAPVRTGKLREDKLDMEAMLRYKERLERVYNQDANIYDKYRRELVPLIDKVENELRQALVDKESSDWKGGLRSGKRIKIKKRIQEKGQKKTAMESRAWQKREQAEEPSYAITLLNDLSGSMRGDLMEADFKAKIVLTEALNKLGLNVEVLGFNDEIYEYQNYGEDLNDRIRDHMGGMFKEVEDSCCKGCGNEHSETDLGWALHEATERLKQQKAKSKIIITLTDDRPAESDKHPRREHELSKVKQEIEEEDEVTLVYYKFKDLDAEKIIEELTKKLKAQIVGEDE